MTVQHKGPPSATLIEAAETIAQVVWLNFILTKLDIYI